MSEDVGILAHGAYIPRKRLQRSVVFAQHAWFASGLKGLAKGERAIADWDEDPITMAVEAARDTLVGIERESVGAVTLASTTLPFVDRLNAGVVKEALGLPDATGALDCTGSQRVATSALIQALQGAGAVGSSPHLCLAAEMRKARPASEAELQNGDAAAGLLVGKGRPIAKFLGAHSVTLDFVDHYRTPDMDFDYGWESRWVRDEGFVGLTVEALKAGLAKQGLGAEDVAHLVVPIVARGVAGQIAKSAAIAEAAVADPLLGQLGDSGAAHPFVMLCAALERASPGEKLVVIGFGQGVDVLVFEATAELRELAPRRGVGGSLERRVPDENYMRWLFHRGLVDLERGMRAELDQKQPFTTLWRNRKAVLGLVGSRCRETGTVQFPPSDVSVSPNGWHAHTQEPYSLAERRAQIVTFTADSLTYSPDPPGCYGLVDFEGGGRLTMEFADVAPEDLVVGREMRMAFRIKATDEQRGFIKYFWKAVPVD
jgi:3-hydroxy-3-methylglutaryl CoA synthase